MTLFRGLLISVAALAVIIVGGGFFLPASMHVERSIVIQAQAAEVFPFINNYRKFNEWSPWAPRDPNMDYTFSGPEEGTGAKMAWRSDNGEVGSGSQEIIESTPNKRIVTALDFDEMGTARASFLLQPEGGATKVTWSLDSDKTGNPIARWMGLLMNSLLGADYEEGLKRLKKKIETGTV